MAQQTHQGIMPDVATGRARTQGMLNRVGMSDIKLPLTLALDNSTSTQVQARAQAYVSLDVATAKGIHMSRLYKALDAWSLEQSLTPENLTNLLENFLSSHTDLSQQAALSLDFNAFLRRKSLKSDNTGWKGYPCKIVAEYTETGPKLEIQVDVPYSSTCPCSAALARQLIQENFKKTFSDQQSIDIEQAAQWLASEEGIIATPHSQRSTANVRLTLNGNETFFPIQSLIDSVEDALQTPVQATVKREDEQEFARLNGTNTMFCEDAARRIHAALTKDVDAKDWFIRVNHFESLHDHDAVAIKVKGVEGGYQPSLW